MTSVVAAAQMPSLPGYWVVRNVQVIGHSPILEPAHYKERLVQAGVAIPVKLMNIHIKVFKTKLIYTLYAESVV